MVVAVAGCVLVATPCRAALRVLSSGEMRAEVERETEPVLACSPAVLSATVREGESAGLKLTVRNAGGRMLAWRAFALSDGIRVSPDGGELGHGRKAELDVSVGGPQARFRGTSAPGGFSRTVVVVAPGVRGSPQRIEVRVHVEDFGELSRAAADDGEEKASESPRRDTRPAPRRSKGDAEPRLGVRAGFLAASGGRQTDSGAGALVGVYLRAGSLDETTVSYEFGVDVATGDEGEQRASVPLLGRVDVLFRLGAAEGRRVKGYLALGIGSFVELVEDVDTNERYTHHVAAANLGGGVQLRGGRLDMRVTHAVFLGSENLRGRTVLAVAYVF